MPKKALFDLKEARVNRMIEERESLERERKQEERKALQNQIMKK